MMVIADIYLFKKICKKLYFYKIGSIRKKAMDVVEQDGKIRIHTKNGFLDNYVN